MPGRIAVVTGGNKGIGLTIVRALCQQSGQDDVVYLTARNEHRGHQAIQLLKKEGLFPRYHPLDVADKASVERLKEHLKATHGGLDILVNNAGIGIPNKELMSLCERAVVVLTTNFFGLLEVSNALIPILRSGGRVVNVASTSAHMTYKELSEELKTRFQQVSSEQDVVSLMNEFTEAAKADDHVKKGWYAWEYGVSKLGVVALTRVQDQEIAMDKTRQDILINACCPGFVATDMSAHLPDGTYGAKKIGLVEGADTPVYLALLPPGTEDPHGQFVLRREVRDFFSPDIVIQL